MKLRMKAGEIAGLLVLGMTATVVGLVIAGVVLLVMFFGGH